MVEDVADVGDVHLRPPLTDESQQTMRPLRLGRTCRSTRYDLPRRGVLSFAIGMNEPVGTWKR